MPEVPEETLTAGIVSADAQPVGESDVFDAAGATKRPNAATRSVADFLRAAVPFGAAALQTVGHRGPIPLPIVAPPCFPRGQSQPERCAMVSRLQGLKYVDVALAEYVDYTEEQRSHLGRLLTHGFARADGLPGWNPNIEDLGPVDWLTCEHNNGLIGRAVLTAIYADLDSRNVCRAFRGGESDPRRAREYRRRGRLALHRLGIWPWSQENDGRLPHGWNGCTRLPGWYLEPLTKWARDTRAGLR